MYLKSLEIQGFKSFPEKTRLTFEKPITGIVGPNGSGKSNISDAILWVMGEQSTRTLRGGKMEDVIFGGTQRRAQLGFAEVSLIIDNSEGLFQLDNTEVMITRRYYRSGESEYYINRSLVRLRDVNELLMDTGLGREGYSIIGQGKIDEILSTKSKDRREIFEEAAGISRYRHRKEESERKLQQTDDNLLRINDKISELELQVEPLRAQAETAKRFLLLRDELRGLEISAWLRELEDLRTRAEKNDVDYAAAKESLESVSRELEAGFAKSEATAERMRQCDVESDSVRELISSRESQLGELDSAVAVLKSQLEGNTGQIERLNQELLNQDSRQDGVGAQISEREKRLSEIASERETLNGKTDTLAKELQAISGSAGEGNDEISALLRRENETNSELSAKRAALSALASQAQELYDRESGVSRELADAGEKHNVTAKEHEICSDELEKTRQEAQSLTNVISGFAIRAQNRAKKAETASDKRDRIASELKTLESRRNMLSDMEKEYQGYSRAVKLIMQDSTRGVLKNIHGTVAERIKTGDKYTIAIETALGGAMQSIIVESEEDGKAAINHLKRREGGRATFLPISAIKGGIMTDREVGEDPGFEGVALKLVEFDPLYAGIYASLLGRVVIADDLTSAVRISKRHNNRFKIVTLDGQVINAGGSMTGGSTVNNAGMLSRANELEQLAARLEAFTDDLKQADSTLSECVREKNAAEYELETARAELRIVEDKLLKLELEERHRMQLLSAAEDAIDAFERELSDIKQRIDRNGVQTKEAQSSISQIEADTSALKQQIEQALRGQEELTAAREKINEEMSGLKAESASLDAEREALNKSVTELMALQAEMSGSRERQLDTIDGLKNRNLEIRAEILEKEREAVGVHNVIEEHKQRLADLTAKKLELEAERVSLSKGIQEKNREILDMERECSRLEQKKLAAQMEEKQIADKLWDSYELTRSTAAGAGTPIDSLADAQRAISKLKRQISELGNPNIGAIEEFERVNTRYQFLTSQRDDVEKAKNELTGIITEITAHMQDIFIREFKVINECFEKTFKELFGGGRASLVLEDTSDVLNCGIEIQVQPPGKSLKTLTLLSGGEKAFVAIAIYFAILTVRPTPFVVLDEIEAALDDANVLRFAEHMRRMSGNTQMIVITHRRGTMEEADILYGVTMQELGVSSILKVDVDEAEKNFVSIGEGA